MTAVVRVCDMIVDGSWPHRKTACGIYTYIYAVCVLLEPAPPVYNDLMHVHIVVKYMQRLSICVCQCFVLIYSIPSDAQNLR